MIDKYRLDDLRLESGEKGELARWVIQLQKDLDYERRKVPVPPAMAAKGSEPVADVVAWYKEGEERTCDIRLRRFDVAPGPLFAVAQPVAVVPDEMAISDDMNLYQKSFTQGHNACRAAMLQAGNSPVIPDGSNHCPCCGKKLRRTCSVEGCSGKRVAHGLCRKHYDMKRREDPEQVNKFREADKRFRDKRKSTTAAPQQEGKL